MKRDPAVGFTFVKIAGLAAAGIVDLSGGVLAGPFAPQQGDLVVSILRLEAGAVNDAFKYDDRTEFASTVGANSTLVQYKAANLSAITLLITFARMR